MMAPAAVRAKWMSAWAGAREEWGATSGRLHLNRGVGARGGR